MKRKKTLFRKVPLTLTISGYGSGCHTLSNTLINTFFFSLVGLSSVATYILFSRGLSSIWMICPLVVLFGIVYQPLVRILTGIIPDPRSTEERILQNRLFNLAGELPVIGQMKGIGEHLTHELKELFDVRYAALFLVDEEAGFLYPIAHHHDTVCEFEIDSILVGVEEPAITYLKEVRHPVTKEDLLKQCRYLEHYLNQYGVEVILPLVEGTEISGIIFFGETRDSKPICQEQMDLLRFFAQHLAVVLNNTRLFESATYDSLTGCFRRQAILEKLETEIRRAERYGRPLSVGMIDLDLFKSINDSYGHLSGDVLLKKTAAILQESIRSTDLVGRFGGDEFLIIFPETPVDRALELADRIRDCLEKASIYIPDNGFQRMTLSMGVTSLDSIIFRDNRTIDTLVGQADFALYQAKKSGGNSVTYFSPASLAG